MIPYQHQLLTVDGGQWRPNTELAPNCPRCDSSNTKFCYYNNYSLSQPRYFCKACRRYWTKGGALRNVPVGGGCRKKRRSAAKPQRQLANINHHQTRQNSLRPDLVLDGMSSSASDSSASDASASIDMVELYAKYLNPATTDHEANIGKKSDGFVAETLATDQANFSVGDQLELVDGMCIDQFFGSSNCTGDSAWTRPGPVDGFGIVDGLISYQGVMGSEYWNNCNQFSSLDAMHST